MYVEGFFIIKIDATYPGYREVRNGGHAGCLAYPVVVHSAAETQDWLEISGHIGWSPKDQQCSVAIIKSPFQTFLSRCSELTKGISSDTTYSMCATSLFVCPANSARGVPARGCRQAVRGPHQARNVRKDNVGFDSEGLIKHLSEHDVNLILYTCLYMNLKCAVFYFRL